MSQTVRTKSILRRSSVCTRLAKVVMVFLSLRSRRCAVSDMTKWFAISHATVSVSASLRPRRGESARDFDSGTGMILHSPLGDIVQEKRKIKRPPIGDRRQNLARQGKSRGKPLRFDLGKISHRAQEMLI